MYSCRTFHGDSVGVHTSQFRPLTGSHLNRLTPIPTPITHKAGAERWVRRDRESRPGLGVRLGTEEKVGEGGGGTVSRNEKMRWEGGVRRGVEPIEGIPDAEGILFRDRESRDSR